MLFDGERLGKQMAEEARRRDVRFAVRDHVDTAERCRVCSYAWVVSEQPSTGVRACPNCGARDWRDRVARS